MKYIVALASLSLLMGCNAQINSFVNEAVKTPAVPLADSTATSKAIKFSPGAVQSSGSQISAKATITPTSRTLKGSQIQATLSISQNRKN